MDWNLIRSFLVVARLGSLSAAARELGLSQPTLSRQIQALETAMELNLFRRTTQGLRLTQEGESLVETAAEIGEAADRFTRQAAGMSTELEGDIRVSANEIVGSYLLPIAIAAFCADHPGVHVEVVISNRPSSLSKREADIALRMYRPTQPDLVARRLPDLELGFYAHRQYLADHGAPQNFDDLVRHTLIGFDEGMDFIDGAARLGYHFTRNHFALRTDSLLMQLSLLRAGVGICGTHVALARHWPELRRIMDWVALPPLQFWCVAHGDMQYNPRIRAFVRFLIDWFAEDPYRHALV